MALAAANLEPLRLAINELEVGQEPPKDFPNRAEILMMSSQTQKVNPKEEQKQRFHNMKFLAEAVGTTNEKAIVGPGLCVFTYPSVEGQGSLLCCLSKNMPTASPLHLCTDEVDFFRDPIENLNRVEDRRSQANALESAEELKIITEAEAIMASRHISAYRAALKICQHRGLYNSSQSSNMGLLSLLNSDTEKCQTKARTILERFNHVYRGDVGYDVFAHAISFYHTYLPEFPPAFEEDCHLDWFIMWYRDLVWNEALQQVDRVKPSSILRYLEQSLKLQVEGQTESSIITSDNLDDARWTSEIAINDARPPIWSHNPCIRSPWEVLIDHGIISDDEDKQGVELEDLANFLTPYDVSNWQLWSKHFWASKDKPILRSLRMPRFAILNIRNEDSCKASTQLRQYEKAFQKWSEDVVAILVYADMREAALHGNLAEMSRLYRHVKEMMRGRRPVDLYIPGPNDEETDDEEGTEHQSDRGTVDLYLLGSDGWETDDEETDGGETDEEGDQEHQSERESVDELTDGIGKLKFGLDADGEESMV